MQALAAELAVTLLVSPLQGRLDSDERLAQETA